MSNKLNIHNYASNGRSGEGINIKSTKIKSGNKEYQTTNGRFFNNSYNKEILNKDIMSDIKETEKKDFVSWVVNTLNPINHIPLISTLNNLNKDKKSSLDMVQSAIGGIIYGGGVGGIAKGLGGWFVGKLLPKKIITADSKLEKDKNLIIMNNGRITGHNNNMIKKVNYKKSLYKFIKNYIFDCWDPSASTHQQDLIKLVRRGEVGIFNSLVHSNQASSNQGCR